jgi:hypothetical protein
VRAVSRADRQRPWEGPQRDAHFGRTSPRELRARLAHTKEKARFSKIVKRASFEIIPAATYSPTHLRMQYHRRWQA